MSFVTNVHFKKPNKKKQPQNPTKHQSYGKVQ